MPEFVVSDNLITGGPIAWDPVWRPMFVGNGRLRISGQVQLQTTIQWIKYKINAGPLTQVETNLVAGDKFSFWTGPYEQGEDYTLEIHVLDGQGLTVVGLTESFTWNIPVRDMTTRFREFYMPPFMYSSELAGKLYDVLAKAYGDLISAFDDASVQMVPQYTTWMINEWERQLELPTVQGAPLSIRRLEITNFRRGSFESRTNFIDMLQDLTGGTVTLSESFATYVVTITITSPTNSIPPQHVTRLVDKIKPVGLTVNIVYA